MPGAESSDQTATPGGPTASKSRAAARLCVPAPALAVVVKAIIVVPSSTCDDLYALM
jgi:hypothetical protein